ncbi:MAG TPA: VOC family protein [Thermomicrobiales bacterium]|nr:VOC family protein [Thermomicrobiales bacterium]
MSVTFDVIGIAVRDMRASLQFYRRLGLPVPDGMEGEMHVEMSLGGIRLAWDTVEMLQDVYNGWDEPSGHCVELAFRCDTREEVDEVYDRLMQDGYRGHKEPWDALWRQRYAIVKDPDGNLMSLYA